jgi:hypothetical protein
MNMITARLLVKSWADQGLNQRFRMGEEAGPNPLDLCCICDSFISNLSDDRSTASSKTIPPLNVI